MSNLEIYNERLADSGRRVFARALNGARQRGQNYVVIEHLIEALVVEEDRFFQLLEGLLKIDAGQVQTLMASRLESFPQKAGGGMRLAPSAIALLKQAWKVAHNNQRMKIESFDLIFAMAKDERGLLIELIKGLNPDLDSWAETIQVLLHFIHILSPQLIGEGSRQITRKGLGPIYIPSKIPRKDPRPTRPRKIERGGE